ncbi:hypothetical protein J6590_077630 [Homalodisca vitripennis]|nr:hypothetical protein J6590_077630 [Homalodisca vitripennis]
MRLNKAVADRTDSFLYIFFDLEPRQDDRLENDSNVKCSNKREELLKEDPSDTLELRYKRRRAKMEKLSKIPYELADMWI